MVGGQNSCSGASICLFFFFNYFLHLPLSCGILEMLFASSQMLLWLILSGGGDAFHVAERRISMWLCQPPDMVRDKKLIKTIAVKIHTVPH